MAPSLDKVAPVKAPTAEYSFPQHGITIVASSLTEAYTILEQKLQAKDSKE